MTSMTGQAENINGMRMYYEVHGQGEPLVLLHGFTGSGGDWAPFVNGWAAEHQLIIPDLRGHGGSTNPSEVFTRSFPEASAICCAEISGSYDLNAILPEASTSGLAR